MTSILPRTVLYYGEDKPPAEFIELRAGPVSAILQPDDAFLRYIRLGDREILRGVYVAVRDQLWGTVKPAVSDLRVEQVDETFEVTFDVECKRGDIVFRWQGKITGDEHGGIVYTMNGAAHSTFMSSRVGFCVLHPILECAGRPCVVEKVDGSQEAGAFPEAIAPHQPFTDIRAISHFVLPGLTAEVRFEGDTFEMEDQRNWTDASYKTYCRPLSLPFPFEVSEGTTIAQSVILGLKGQASRKPRSLTSAGEVVLKLQEKPSFSLPRVGLGMASHGQPLSADEIGRLKALNLSHLRVDLVLSDVGHKAALALATEEAKRIGISLEIALFLSKNAEDELHDLARELARINPPVSRWLIFSSNHTPTGREIVNTVRNHLSVYDEQAAFGTGSDTHFAELNRNHPPVEALDMVCYPVTPQVHTFDNWSMVETLPMLGWTIATARQFVDPQASIAVTPITLKPRFSPSAKGKPIPTPAGQLPAPVDARQMSLFGAAWTLGSFKDLAEEGAASVTYYETTGWRGIMETEAGSPMPEVFRSFPGGVFPMYHVFADIGEFAGGRVIQRTWGVWPDVEEVALRKNGKTRVLLANLVPEDRQVRLEGLSGQATVKYLDETNAEHAMISPEEFRAQPGEQVKAAGRSLTLTLRPYAIARVDCE